MKRVESFYERFTETVTKAPLCISSFVISVYEKLRKGGEEKEKGREEKEIILLSISRKIGEAYSWLRDKLYSFFKLFSESITKAFLGLKSFVESCFEKLREVVSWIFTQLQNLFQKKKLVDDVVSDEGGSPLGGMKILARKARSSVNQLFGIGNSNNHEMTLFLRLFEGFIELLQYGYEKPFLLIRIVFDGFSIYLNSKKAGRFTISAGQTGKAAMAIATLISLILGSKCPLLALQ